MKDKVALLSEYYAALIAFMANQIGISSSGPAMIIADFIGDDLITSGIINNSKTQTMRSGIGWALCAEHDYMILHITDQDRPNLPSHEEIDIAVLQIQRNRIIELCFSNELWSIIDLKVHEQSPYRININAINFIHSGMSNLLMDSIIRTTDELSRHSIMP